MNLWAIFLVGLTTGGLSCLAVQGGLLASVIANQKEAEKENSGKLAQGFDILDWLPVVMFLVAKLIAHTLLGLLLGAIGSTFKLSLSLQLFFQGLAALFMLATALNMLEAHPIFRYVIIQPPRFIRKLVKNTSRGHAIFTPALLGFLTIFIPCGVTQSIEVQAISSGSAVIGALTMFAFILGTAPLFATIGVATARLTETYQRTFNRVAAAILIFLAVSSLNGILIVLNSPLTLGRLVRPITYFFSDERFENAGKGLGNTEGAALIVDNKQQVVILAQSSGYAPRYVKVKAGVPVQLTVQTKNTYSCASYFTFPQFGIKAQLGSNDSKTFTFTPDKPGKYRYTCSMGMYTGIMEVI